MFKGFIQIVWKNESGCRLSKTADLLKRAVMDGSLSGVGNKHEESEQGRTIGIERSCAVSGDMI